MDFYEALKILNVDLAEEIEKKIDREKNIHDLRNKHIDTEHLTKKENERKNYERIKADTKGKKEKLKQAKFRQNLNNLIR